MRSCKGGGYEKEHELLFAYSSQVLPLVLGQLLGKELSLPQFPCACAGLGSLTRAGVLLVVQESHSTKVQVYCRGMGKGLWHCPSPCSQQKEGTSLELNILVLAFHRDSCFGTREL